MNNIPTVDCALVEVISIDELRNLLAQLLNTELEKIFFLQQDDENYIEAKSLVDYSLIENSEFRLMLSISFHTEQYKASQHTDLELLKIVSKQLNRNLYVGAPNLFDYSILYVTPSGDFYGANERTDENDFEYLTDRKKLTKRLIKKFQLLEEKDLEILNAQRS